MRPYSLSFALAALAVSVAGIVGVVAVADPPQNDAGQDYARAEPLRDPPRELTKSIAVNAATAVPIVYSSTFDHQVARCLVETTDLPVYIVEDGATSTAQGLGPFCDTCNAGPFFPVARGWALASSGSGSIRCGFFDRAPGLTAGGSGMSRGLADSLYLTTDTAASTFLKLDASNDPLTGALAMTDFSTSGTTWTSAQDFNIVANGGQDAFSIDGDTFSVDALNDWIGFGTSAPTYSLDVKAATNAVLNLRNGGGGSSTSSRSEIYMDRSSGSYFDIAHYGYTATGTTFGLANASQTFIQSRNTETANAGLHIGTNTEDRIVAFYTADTRRLGILSTGATFSVPVLATHFRAGVGTPYTSAGYGFTGDATAVASGLYYDDVGPYGTTLTGPAATIVTDGAVLISSEGASDTVYVGTGDESIELNNNGTITVLGDVIDGENTLSLSLKVSTSTSTYNSAGGQRAGTVAKPACSSTTNAGEAGRFGVFDDDDDASPAVVCVCMAATATASTLSWQRMDDNTAACPL